MKRSFAICLAISTALAVVACNSPAENLPDASVATDGWVTGPQVERVVRSGVSITVSGTGLPFGRVVLTGPNGIAYAAGADDQGHFDVRIPAPKQDVLLAVEAQVGQIAYPAPDRLLIAADPRGPVALLGIGAPTRRLDVAGPLDAIDTDGRAAFLSGRAAPDTTVDVVRGGIGGNVSTDAKGRWTQSATGDGGAPVQVAGQAFVPPPMMATTDGIVERAGEGWRIGWISAQGGRQVTWFPDAPRS